MTDTASLTTSSRAHSRFRSMIAVTAGFLTVAGLSLATDQVLHVLEVYPPWGEPMFSTGLNLLALSYRTLYTILGGYVTARLAPHSPMRHVVVCGAIGLLLGTAGAIAAITMADLGPRWYPIAVAVTGFPCVWLGGVLHRRARAIAGRPPRQERRTVADGCPDSASAADLALAVARRLDVEHTARWEDEACCNWV
jgi:hypothetical protein